MVGAWTSNNGQGAAESASAEPHRSTDDRSERILRVDQYLGKNLGAAYLGALKASHCACNGRTTKVTTATTTTTIRQHTGPG